VTCYMICPSYLLNAGLCYIRWRLQTILHLLLTPTLCKLLNISATIEMDSGATFADNFLIDNRNIW